MVFVGIDNKIYTLSGDQRVVEKIASSPKRMMGYRRPLAIKGSVDGNQRAWILYALCPQPMKEEGSKKTTVTGTVVCVIPNYKQGNVKPVVAVGPCNEYSPHLHVIYNKYGQIYALHGSEQGITNIEKRPERKNVHLTGGVGGNNSGWILFVD